MSLLSSPFLAAILFPVFARARENARRSSCQSNLKQVALGVLQYTQDYDEDFPLAVVSTTSPQVPPVGWADAIQPYLKSTQIYQCPSEPTPPTDNPVQPVPYVSTPSYTDYWYNCNLSAPSDTATGFNTSVSLSAAANPTLTVLNGDGSGGSGAYRCSGASSNGDNNTGSPSTGGSGYVTTAAVVARHLDGINLSFVDGHVKWYKANGAASGSVQGAIYKSGTAFDVSMNSPTFRVRP